MKLSSILKINAPADRVWQVIAHDFANISHWASGVPKSTVNVSAAALDGATVGGRTCDVPGFGKVNETFTAYNEAAKSFTYEAEGGPFFLRSAHNSWQVSPLNEHETEVSLAAELVLMPVFRTLMAPILRRQLNKIVAETTEELKYYVETGEIHPRKRALLQA
ncbi:MAG: SRPBCC family protein [Chloroflexota bacterium]